MFLRRFGVTRICTFGRKSADSLALPSWISGKSVLFERDNSPQNPANALLHKALTTFENLYFGNRASIRAHVTLDAEGRAQNPSPRRERTNQCVQSGRRHRARERISGRNPGSWCSREVRTWKESCDPTNFSGTGHAVLASGVARQEWDQRSFPTNKKRTVRHSPRRVENGQTNHPQIYLT